MALSINGTGIAEWAPGNIIVSIADGGAGDSLTVSIDGDAVAQTIVLGADGSQPNVTIVIPYLDLGVHELELAGADTGTFSFTVKRAVPVDVSTPTVPPSPSPQSSPNRWQFEDPITHEIYVFPINPSTASAPFGVRHFAERTTTTGQPLTYEGNERSSTWVLTGYINGQEQHDAFSAWSAKPYRIFVTDDFGRQYVGVITDFAPVPLSPRMDGGIAIRSKYRMLIELGLL